MSEELGAGKPQPEDKAERQLLVWQRVTIPLNNTFQRHSAHRNSKSCSKKFKYIIFSTIMRHILGSPHQCKKSPYCQCDISHRDRTEHAGNILSQHTDKVMSYIRTTALATSPEHSTDSVLLYSAFTVPHLFQLVMQAATLSH